MTKGRKNIKLSQNQSEIHTFGLQTSQSELKIIATLNKLSGFQLSQNNTCSMAMQFSEKNLNLYSYIHQNTEFVFISKIKETIWMNDKMKNFDFILIIYNFTPEIRDDIRMLLKKSNLFLSILDIQW